MKKYLIFFLITLILGCQTTSQKANQSSFPKMVSLNPFNGQLARPDFRDVKPATNENIIGTWASKTKYEGTENLVESRITYLPSGKWTSIGFALINGERITLSYNGTWELEGEFLTTKVEDSNNPQILPRGFVVTSKILGISKEQSISVSPLTGDTMVGYKIE